MSAPDDVLECLEIVPGDLVNAGCYVLGPEIFSYAMVKLPGRPEYGLPQTLAFAAKDRPVQIVRTERWLSVSSPEDIAQISEFLTKVEQPS